MSEHAVFPITLDVGGRLCVVIGGDDEASERASRLLEAGAKVVVVHPTLNTSLRKFAASAKIIHRGRHFRSTDTQDAFLILNLLQDDPELSKSLFELSQKERFLIWSMDQPGRSNFFMPAVAERGRLRVAISTCGASPALASLLRQNCEGLFDEDFGKFLDWLGAMREDLKNNEPNDSRRRERLMSAVEGFALTGQITYPASWVAQKEQVPSS